MASHDLGEVIDLDSDSDTESDCTVTGDTIEDQDEDVQAAAAVEALEALTISCAMTGNPVDIGPSDELDRYPYHGMNLRARRTVELVAGDFLRIISIHRQHASREVFLKGNLFRRANEISDMLEKKKNEVVWVVHPDSAIQQTWFRVEDAICFRNLIITNASFPTFSFREDEYPTPMNEIDETARLVCRWKVCRVSKTEGYLIRVAAHESSSEKSVQEVVTQQGGQYTFGDAFCGAGGTSEGARQANLEVKWGFDQNASAMKTYALNFEGATCITASVDQAIALADGLKADLLHLSPPCQPFSPMHIWEGKDDEANEAAFLAVGEILSYVSPRVATLEETLGLITHRQHAKWFRTLVHMFTCRNYSVRWKLVNLLDFGLPQPRRRVLIFASR